MVRHGDELRLLELLGNHKSDKKKVNKSFSSSSEFVKGWGMVGTFNSQGGQELSPVWLCADITEVPVAHSSVLASTVPPRPPQPVSEPASSSRSIVGDDAS